jgi:ATP-dependent Clp protease ATP-binding subunit ClpA
MTDDEVAALVRRWREDEARLYPVVMVRPDLYERAGLIVRALADELRIHTTVEALAAAFPSATQTLNALLARRGLPTDDVDLALVIGAAFGMRHREILAALERRRILVLIAEARDRGDEWVDLHRTGTPDRTGYRCLEMHLRTGAALHLFIEPDPATGRPIYGLQQLTLDPATGDPERGREIEDARTFEDEAAWTKAVTGLREYLQGE